MQREIQPVVWMLSSGKDKILEFDGNKTVTFSDEIVKASEKYELFSLYDAVNDILYSINLNTGEIIFNGIAVSPSKEIYGRMLSFANLGNIYRKGLIQYKESYPISVGSDEPVKPMTFNIGYKIDTEHLNLKYDTELYSSKIIRFKFILSIRNETLKPGISFSITEKRTSRDGTTITVRF